MDFKQVGENNMKCNDLLEMLGSANYFANPEIGYAVLGTIDTSLPLLIEGDPGVGKTSLATALASALNIPLIRIQCYEGIVPESILYDYDYQRQLLVVSAIRDKLNEAMREMSVAQSVQYVARNVEFYGSDFLLERPVLRALTTPGRKVLLIDEIDKTSEEIEHTLLETLSDFAMTIPEYGTVSCREEDRPIVILTSNRYRELSDALKRRCIYLYIRQKTHAEIQDILRLKVADDEEFCSTVAGYLYQITQLDLQHPSSISEGIAWAKFLKEHGETDAADIQKNAPYTIGFLAKSKSDQNKILKRVFGGVA